MVREVLPVKTGHILSMQPCLLFNCLGNDARIFIPSLAAYLAPPPLRRSSPHSLLNLLRMYVYIYLHTIQTYIHSTYLYWRVVYLPPLLASQFIDKVCFCFCLAYVMAYLPQREHGAARRGTAARPKPVPPVRPPNADQQQQWRTMAKLYLNIILF